MASDPFDSAWKKSMKVGDKVIVRNRYNGDNVATVETATKTHFTLAGDHGRRWRRNSYGYVGQSGWLTDSVIQWTADADEAIRTLRRRARILSALRDTNWNSYDDATLARVLAALDTKEVRDGE